MSSLTDSLSSSFQFETPNFFGTAPDSQSNASSQITDSMEHDLWIEAQLNALHSSGTLQNDQTKNASLGGQSKILEGVKAYVDVKFKKAPALRQILRNLGAVIRSRFSKNVTHLIFWNGRQETLDKVHRLKSKIPIVSPHWVFKCFVDQIRADEAPYMLYGVTGLAIPVRLMAMGRIGTVNKNSYERASMPGESSPSHSQIVYAIETLSDQLASKLTSPVSDENVDAVEIISPIVDRVRKRLNELSVAKNTSSGCRTSKPNSNREVITVELSDDSGSTEPVICDVSNQHPSLKPKGTARPSRRHTISRISMSCGEPSARRLTTSNANNSNSAATVNLVEGARSEPAKRRGRPPINSEELAEYTPTRFHRYLQRRCRSVKAKRALQLNTENMVRLYRNMVDKDFVETPTIVQRSSKGGKILKARPVVVRTRSSVLNDLQNAPSSNEFIKKEKNAKRKRKIGNIVLSGIGKIERETVFAIAQKLGVLRIASAVDEHTRYVVSDEEGARTVNVMRALVKGIPVVTVEWAYRSLEVGGWLKGKDFLVPCWKTAHRAWVKGHMTRLFSSLGPFYVSAKCNPEAKHLLHLIRCCHGKITESLNRAAIFVASASDWEALRMRRKDTDTQATFITEQLLLDSICECKINFQLQEVQASTSDASFQ